MDKQNISKENYNNFQARKDQGEGTRGVGDDSGEAQYKARIFLKLTEFLTA